MKPVIFGLEGTRLTETEKAFFKTEQPFGYILFARNIENPEQLLELTNQLHALTPNKTIIFIDQEGGRVQRMSRPHWRQYPTMATFGKMAEGELESAKEALSLNLQLLCDDLTSVGINANCLPLLDVPIDGADPIIGDRAFGTNSDIVEKLGEVCIEGLLASGVLPVIKHIPGHGRADVDSHLALPIVTTDLDELEETDFQPFRTLKLAPFAMTAHVVYTAIDPDNPATLSEKVIGGIIREKIGFEGLLMTDDVSMKALTGSLEDISLNALSAGCDLVLHCNGNMAEMKRITSVIPNLPSEGVQRRDQLLKNLKTRMSLDTEAIENRYNQLLAAAG